MVKHFITLSQKASLKERELALAIGKQLDLPFVERDKLSVKALYEKYYFEAALLVEQEGVALLTKEGKKHRFHLSMAQLRLIAIQRGQKDNLLEALGDSVEDSFLDATLGLGSDAVIVSYAYPKVKRIVGVEGMKELAFITNEGFRYYIHKDEKVTKALRRIEVRAMDHLSYLQAQKSESFDVVYFDPMFFNPVEESPQFQALRGVNWGMPLREEAFKEACRVAKKKVVIKDRPFGATLMNFPLHYRVGGKYSRIAYGIYDKTYE